MLLDGNRLGSYTIRVGVCRCVNLTKQQDGARVMRTCFHPLTPQRLSPEPCTPELGKASPSSMQKVLLSPAPNPGVFDQSAGLSVAPTRAPEFQQGRQHRVRWCPRSISTVGVRRGRGCFRLGAQGRAERRCCQGHGEEMEAKKRRGSDLDGASFGIL